MIYIKRGLLLVGCIFSIFSLSGCSSSNSSIGQEIYASIQNNFMSSNVFAGLSGHSFFSDSGVTRESLGIYSKVDSSRLLTDMTIGWTMDHGGGNTVSLLSFSGILHDLIHNDILMGSGEVYYIDDSNNAYIKWADGYISMGEGNAETFILSLIFDSIRDLWLLIDDNALINQDYFSVSLGYWLLPVLQESKHIVDSMVLDIAQQQVGGVYPVIGSGMYSQGYDIGLRGYITTDPRPKLVIKNLDDNKQTRSLQGHVGVREGEISLAYAGKVWQVARQEKRNSIAVSVGQLSGDDIIWELSLDIVQEKLVPDSIVWAYNGIIRIAFPGQGSNNLLDFPIAGLYGISIVDETIFATPVSYVLMSQLFGDEYGILSLLESE